MGSQKNSNVTFTDTWSSPVFNQQIQLILISLSFICVWLKSLGPLGLNLHASVWGGVAGGVVLQPSHPSLSCNPEQRFHFCVRAHIDFSCVWMAASVSSACHSFFLR